ncbi:MAG: TonB-dependent receptor [Sphingomicrobium sp.]
MWGDVGANLSRGILLSGISLLICPRPALAQPETVAAGEKAATEEEQPSETIVVTAQRRSEDIRDVPISVTAISGDALQARGIEQLSDLYKVTSGLVIGRAAGVLQPFLRGIGNPATANGNESSVAVYVDEVFFSRLPTAAFSLGNIERVEILKGPQGTLFGRNASAGVIQIITRDPSHTPGINGTVSVASYETLEGNSYATTGISDTLALDFAVAGRWQADGYGRNIITGTRNSYEDYASGKMKLLWEPSAFTTIRTSLMRAWNKLSVEGNTYPGTTAGYESLPLPAVPFTTIGFYDTRFDTDSYAKADVTAASVKIDQELPFATLTSISAWSRTDVRGIVDLDFSERPDAIFRYRGHISLWTQELKLSSAARAPVNWVAGLYYYNSLSTYDHISFRSPSGLALPPSVQPGGLTAAVAGLDSEASQRAKSYAAYGQLTWQVSDPLSLTGGLRYTHDDTRAEGSTLVGTVTRVALGLQPLQVAGPPNRVKDDRLTWRVAAAYDFDDRLNAYLSASRGYKAGIFNLLLYASQPAKAEVVDAYEAGIKSVLFDGRLHLNAALFWMDVADPMVQIVTGSTLIFSNAESARSKGFEFDGTARVSDNLTVNFAGTFADARYRSYTNAVCAPQNPLPPFGRVRPAVQCDASGHYLPRAPKFTSNLGFEYRTGTSLGNLTLSGNWSHNSGYFQQPSNDLRQDSYEIIDASAHLAVSEHLGLRLWAENIGDAKYTNRAGENLGPAGSPFQAGSPRVVGATIDFRF